MTSQSSPDFGLAENIYGHVKRLEWIASHLEPGDRVLEIGCGTGYMITLPLIRAGWDARGIDTDARSIEYGRDLLRAEGRDPERLKNMLAEQVEDRFDAVIVSEVLEHIPDAGIQSLLAAVQRLLKPGGELLVTVPNGYGAFELESLVWNKLGIGWLIRESRLQDVIERIKMRLSADQVVYEHVSSLDSSPHVQRFTLRSIVRVLEAAGFEVVDRRATVLLAGPFSNLLFTGFRRVQRADSRLGDMLPSLSSSFMVSAVVRASAPTPDPHNVKGR